MLNPWAILAVAIFYFASIGGVGYKAYQLGGEHVIAQQVKTEKLIEEVAAKAQLAAATEIANIKVVNQHSKQVLEREIIEKPVYRDCVNTADGLRAINSALAGEPLPADGGKLPKADTPK
jgi:hypothetical protein